MSEFHFFKEDGGALPAGLLYLSGAVSVKGSWRRPPPEEVFSALQYSGTEVLPAWLRQSCCTCWRWWLSWLDIRTQGWAPFLCQEARKAWLDRHDNLDEAVEECVRTRRGSCRQQPPGGEAGLRAVDLRASHTLIHSFSPPNSQVQEPGPWALGLRKGLFKPYSNMGVMWHEP